MRDSAIVNRKSKIVNRSRLVLATVALLGAAALTRRAMVVAPLRPYAVIKQGNDYGGAEFSGDGRTFMTGKGWLTDQLVSRVDSLDDGTFIPPEDRYTAIVRWDLDAARPVFERELHGARNWLSDDGTRVLEESESTKSHNSTLTLCEVGSGRTLWSRHHHGRIDVVSPDLKWMLVAKPDGLPHELENIVTGQRRPLPPSLDNLEVDFENGSQLLMGTPVQGCGATGNENVVVRTDTLQTLVNIRSQYDFIVSSDGTRAYSLNGKGQCQIWHLATGKRTSFKSALTESSGFKSLPDGRLLICGEAPRPQWQQLKYLKRFFSDQNTVVQILSGDGKQVLQTMPGELQALSNDGSVAIIRNLVPISTSDDTEQYVYTDDAYDTRTGRFLVRFDTDHDTEGNPLDTEHSPYSLSFELSFNGHTAVLDHGDGRLRFYRLE